jgi:hypothetical protein
MSTAQTRPAVDLAEPASRPLLSFVLGVLAIPGSTLAWDLPLGGLWIGLPLAVAAILIGLRARRAPGKSGLAIAGIVLASLAILQMVVWVAASAFS